jgi:N utilization substance protein A
MKGSRVQAIIRELRGEKIDIIQWSDDLVTFAQSALAPAKITRVSVTHHGEVPHLDVIVEDEQLSLAIGKRGQNVRLASELIGAKIDIKSESDVKDEVAGALARMLESAVVEPPPVDLAAELDLTTAPGIGVKTAEKLKEAGFGELEVLLQASPEDLQQVEGIGPKTAQSILDWAAEQQAKRERAVEALASGSAPAPAPPPPPSSSMGDQDFLNALSRAFQESERRKAEAAAVLAEATAEPAGEAAAAAAPEAGADAPAESGGEAPERAGE